MQAKDDLKKELQRAKEIIDGQLYAIDRDQEYPMAQDYSEVISLQSILLNLALLQLESQRLQEKREAEAGKRPDGMPEKVAAFFTNFVQVCEHNIRLDAVCTAYYAHWAMDLMQIPEKRLPSDDAIGGISVPHE